MFNISIINPQNNLLKKRCQCKTANNLTCRKKTRYINALTTNRYCKMHFKLHYIKYILLIQKTYRGYKSRRLLTNIYYKLPEDIQLIVDYYINIELHYKKYTSHVNRIIVNKKNNFYNVFDIFDFYIVKKYNGEILYYNDEILYVRTDYLDAKNDVIYNNIDLIYYMCNIYRKYKCLNLFNDVITKIKNKLKAIRIICSVIIKTPDINNDKQNTIITNCYDIIELSLYTSEC